MPKSIVEKRNKVALSALSALYGLLMAATCMTPMAAHAQDGNGQKAGVEQRLDRLESMVGALMQRLDQSEAERLGAQNALAEARREITIMRAEKAESKELEQRTVELAQRTKKVEAQITEVNDKLIANRSGTGDGFMVGNTRVTYGGYIKLDVLSERTSGGTVPSGSIARDFLIPSLIPVGGQASGFDTDFNTRETRFFFKTDTDVGADHKIGSVLELDFMVTEGGNERISNSFIPRIRQGYITYDNWLFGQTWSTFQDVGALPETLDFIGVTPGTVFDRQPMIRYTSGGFQIAAEQPETTVTTATGARVIGNNDSLPDFVLRYNFDQDWGRFTIAAIGRALSIGDEVLGLQTDTAFGYGVSASGKIKVGSRDDLRFMATYGDGVGRYIGLNIVNDAAVRPDGSLDPIRTYSGFAAYRHFWADNIRSTISGSYFKADNPIDLTTNGVTDESLSAFINLVYSPIPPLNLGIEYLFADRELESGVSGNLQKLQVSAQYTF